MFFMLFQERCLDKTLRDMAPSQGAYPPAQNEGCNTTGTIKEVIIDSLGADLRLISVDQSKKITGEGDSIWFLKNRSDLDSS